MTERDRYLFLQAKVKEAPKEHPDFGRICNCLCHVDDMNIHCSCFVECCGSNHKKYFDVDGNFSIHRFGEAIMNERLARKGKLRK